MFNKRRINSKILAITKKVGRVIACYQQAAGPTVPPKVPTDPYASAPALPDSSYTVFYIFGNFEQDEQQVIDAGGRIAAVTGTITIPWIYKTYLNNTSYFDPYLNGSKFVKMGASIDDESVTVIQKVKSIYLPQNPGVA